MNVVNWNEHYHVINLRLHLCWKTNVSVMANNGENKGNLDVP